MCERRNDSTTSRFSSPGRPKMRSTPSFSKAATSRSDPFNILHLHEQQHAAADLLPGGLCGFRSIVPDRHPANTISPEEHACLRSLLLSRSLHRRPPRCLPAFCQEAMFSLPPMVFPRCQLPAVGRKAPARAPLHAPSGTLGGGPTYPAIFDSRRDGSFFKKIAFRKEFSKFRRIWPAIPSRAGIVLARRPITLAGNATTRPSDRVANFSGDYPCKVDGPIWSN
jgi:hypothetical protein